MNDLTLTYYFHPKDRISIKNVLDAVWQANAGLRKRYPEYVKEENGKLLSNEGTGAITAYQSMLYGPQKGDGAIQENWKRL
jgi:hypothetical protein